METSFPQFPERALPSKAVLYRPLQDVDIYVEDEGSEVFYTELLKRLLDGRCRMAAVIPLRGRANVLKAAQVYSDPGRAIFLIDGDLWWVADAPVSYPENVFVHPCYCVENYLFCEDAMVQIVLENRGDLTVEAARSALRWAVVRGRLEGALVPLFVEFAVAFVLCPEVQTVGRGISTVLQSSSKGVTPCIEESKVAALQDLIKKEILKRLPEKDYLVTRSAIENRVSKLPEPLDIVSGKDFLLPVQMFECHRFGGQKVTRKSFLFRLARHCKVEKLEELRCRILKMLDPVDPTAATE